jgi:sugar lactone lactonase YvrE
VAASYARSGETALALQWFERLATEQSDLVPDARKFPELSTSTEFQRIVAMAKARAVPYQSPAAEAFRVVEADFGPEGIAYDPQDRAFFLGSVRHRKIVRVIPGRAPEDFVANPRQPMDAVLGLHVDAAQRVLWAASHADEDQEGYTAADQGRCALLAIDLSSRAVRSYPVPRDGAHLLNDVAVDAHGTAFVTDSDAGQVWRLSATDAALRPLTPAGSFIYPNGIALDEGAQTLFVADTVGVWRVDPNTGAMRLLAAPRGIAIGSFDGLCALDGRLVGIQPIGVGRVVTLTLNAAHDAVTERHVIVPAHPAYYRPTTAAVADGALYLIADIGSDPTVILKIAI